MPTFKTTKTVEISAGHALTGLPETHKCHRFHGHNYKISVTLSSTSLDTQGMVLDFDIISKYVNQFDHQNLNDFFQPSTAEVFCMRLWDGIEKDILVPLNRGEHEDKRIWLRSVTVSETDGNKATLE